MKSFVSTILASLLAFSAVADLPRLFSTHQAPAAKASARVSEDPAPQPAPPNPAPVPPPGPAPSPPPSPLPPPLFIPTVNLPTAITANPGAWIRLRADTNCNHVIWDSDDTTGDLNVLEAETLVDPFLTIVSSIVPGQYRIKAIAAYSDFPIQSNWCVITILGPRPPPVPPDPPKPVPPDPPKPIPPDPVPPDPPAPTPPANSALTLITIDNVAARSKATSALMVNRAYWDSLKAAGHSYYLLDSNNVSQTAPYKPQVDAAGGIPVLLVVDSNKKLLAAVKFPMDAVGKPNPSPDWVTGIVAKYGGKAPTGKR